MFNRGYFGQVLEGERSAVSKLFCQIAQDPRHRSIVIVEASPADKRVFQFWSMGLAERTHTAETLNRRFGFAHGFDPTKMNASIFLRYVFEMVKLEDQLISVSVPT